MLCKWRSVFSLTFRGLSFIGALGREGWRNGMGEDAAGGGGGGGLRYFGKLEKS